MQSKGLRQFAFAQTSLETHRLDSVIGRIARYLFASRFRLFQRRRYAIMALAMRRAPYGVRHAANPRRLGDAGALRPPVALHKHAKVGSLRQHGAWRAPIVRRNMLARRLPVWAIVASHGGLNYRPSPQTTRAARLSGPWVFLVKRQ